MKHIKTFENINDKSTLIRYGMYLIPYDRNDLDLIKILLKKLDITDKNYDNLIYDLGFREFYSFYVYKYFDNFMIKINYSIDDELKNKKFLFNFQLDYKGELKLSDIEVSTIKYNI